MNFTLSIWQALLIALWIGLVLSRFSVATLQLRFTTLMTALVVGLVMRDVPTALVAGVAIQLALFNVGGAGGSASGEPAFAAAIMVPVVLSGGLNPYQSVVIALPIAVLGSYLYKARFKINTSYMKAADIKAEELDEAGLTREIIVKPLLTSLAIYTVLMLVVLYLGVPLLTLLGESLVQGRLGHVLDVVGRGLAAVGLAAGMVAMGKAKHLPFFFVGYVVAILLPGTSMVTFAILAGAIAFIYILASDADALKSSD
ncbi:PTS sugar transporter subunit IIC [Alkalibacterium sp. MB6]|uniref:PTS sugar transporter subunit IIC n=1 Tax=Alkalibacterium sp. MB6 TaxID=2081965 RepID=UPI00137A18F0|nr:PTS sugar transporter subunit IIC [Alkalibacterium sp. MB6]